MTYFDISDYLYQSLLLEVLEGPKSQRAEFIIQKLGPQWQSLPGFSSIEKFVEKIGSVDPTAKGIYMPWIARLAIMNPSENRTEDLDRLSDDLKAFETHKAKIAKKDINQYRSFQELYDVIAPLTAPRKKTADELKKARELAKLAKVKQDIITVYQGPEGWIRIPKTREASQFLGQNTRWCTASNKHCMFDHYAKDDNLFVIYDKTTKQRVQLHITSGQLAKEDDRNIGIESTPTWAKKLIVDFYKQNNPNLTLKQIVHLYSWSGENLAAGTNHEALLSLMKSYGL
jgi:hypothetical protein